MAAPEKLPAAVEGRESIKSLLEKYKAEYNRAKTEVALLEHEKVRSDLKEFIKKHRLKLPPGHEKLFQKDKAMRELLTSGLTVIRAESIRVNILKSLDKERRANPKQSYSILKQRIKQIASAEVVDTILIVDLLKRVLDQEAVELQKKFSKASELVKAGEKWIGSAPGTAKPKQLRETPAPQQQVFDAFRINLLYQDEYKDLLTDISFL